MSSYDSDAFAKKLLSQLAIQQDVVPFFTLKDGLLRYQGRIWVGSDQALQLKLMTAFHNTTVGGHSGFSVTYARLKQLFAWQGMKKAILQFVQSC